MNMSYCRFENTVRDMRDCLENIEEYDFTNSSDYENTAFKEFFELCQEVLDDYNSNYGKQLEKKQLDR